MTWTKLGDKFPDEIDNAGLSLAAFTLHVCGLCYCNGVLTDGHIPSRIVRRLYSGIDDPEQAAAELVGSGLWLVTEQGYEIADFLRDQRPADRVREDQEHNRQRQARYRDSIRARRLGQAPSGTNGHSPRTKINSASGPGSKPSRNAVTTPRY